MPLSFGHFIWRELMTTDVAAAKSFYGALFGWTFSDMPMGPMTYTIASAGGQQVCGLMAHPHEGAPSAWWSYVHVEDLDAAWAAALANGATPLMEPMDVPNIGRMAGFLDPAGAAVAIFRSLTPQEAQKDMPGVGGFAWETLSTTDVPGALAFYPKVAPWKVGDFGGSPTFDSPVAAVANIMQPPPGVPSHWLTYVVIADLAASLDVVRKGGGKVLMERVDVPTVGHFGVVQDPQGGVIGMLVPAAP